MPTPVRDVVVIGGANVDYLVKGSELPTPGATVQGDLFQEAPGGKGANQAVAVARLGGRAALVACVGRDARGDAIVERLLEEGVEASAVVRDPAAHTGVALVAVDGAGEKQIAWSPGANARLGPAAVTAAASLVATARVVLVQLEVPLETTAEAIGVARAAGVPVVLDPAPAVPLPDEILRGVHVIRPNASEARVLTGVEVVDRASARRAADELLRRGVHAACVGAPGGNLLVTREGETWMPHLPVRVVDATGAGDAFAGALALALAEGSDLPDAARFAHAASALATTRLGAQAALPDRDAVLALLGAERPPKQRAARRLDVVILGGAREELVARAPRLPTAGETIDGEVLRKGPGGRGARQAIAAARLGARVALVARVGADAHGEEILSELRAAGVRTGLVRRDEGAPTGVALALLGRRRETTGAVLAEGANRRLSLDDVEAAARAIERAAAVVASLEVAPRCAAEAFRIARRSGALAILDAGPSRKVTSSLLGLADVAIVSARDAGVLTGMPVTRRRSVLDAARSLLRRGPGAVVLRAGSTTLLLTRGDEIWIPAASPRRSEVPGADDAFTSALAVALAQGSDLARAGGLASAAADLAASRSGMLPTRDEVLRRAAASADREELVLDGMAAPESPGSAAGPPAS